MNPLAYHRAVALAHACGYDWAKYALGLTVIECTCDSSDAPPHDERFPGQPPRAAEVAGTGPHGPDANFRGFHRSAHCLRHNPVALPVPERIEDLHAAYAANCAQRCIEIEEMPTMAGHGDEDDPWMWEVFDDGLVGVSDADDDGLTIGCDGYIEAGELVDVSLASWARLAELVAAVAAADEKVAP